MSIRCAGCATLHHRIEIMLHRGPHFELQVLRVGNGDVVKGKKGRDFRLIEKIRTTSHRDEQK